MIKKILLQHAQALSKSLRKLSQAPFANLMTIGVVAIALALPITLYVFLQSVKLMGDNWDDSAQITLYLKKDVNSMQINALLEKLNAVPEITKAAYISPEEGLKEFEKEAGLSNAVTQLNNNPLPPVIVITPAITANNAAAMDALAAQLKQLAYVDSVQLDMMWIQRLLALVQFAKRIVWALGGLLALAAILIIGNTLRLAIQNSRHEIEVIKLVGGTHAFIRRPFLYTGILFGLIGALIAVLIVNIMFFWLSGPVAKLVGLYQSHFHLAGLSFPAILLLMLLGIGLGMLGSWFAVAKQLNLIAPG